MTGQTGSSFPLFSARRLIYAVILFFTAGAVAVHVGQAGEIWRTLRHGNWWWIAIAALLQLVFLLNQSSLYSAAYQVVGLPVGFGHLLVLVMAAAFVSVVVPGGTLSGAGLMVYDARRRGLDTARALLANVVFFLFDYLAFLAVLFVALVYLFGRGELQRHELVATMILVVLVAALSGLLLLIATAPGAFLKAVHLLGRAAGRMSRQLARHTLDWEEKAREFTDRLSSAVKTIFHRRPALFRAAIHALLVEGIGLLQLQALFLAFGQGPGISRLVIGYAVGILFMIVSVTPQGVGLMEGAMTAAYASVGVPLEQAVLVTFIYRALSFWLPTLTGFVFLKRAVAQW